MYDDDLRVRLLDEAARLLGERGPSGLNLRELAGAAGTSTTAIYSLFGSKGDVLRELYLEGFRRLAAHLDAVPPGPDPILHLLELGHAYIDSALASPHLYMVMFGDGLASTPVAVHPVGTGDAPGGREADLVAVGITEADAAFTLSTLETLVRAVTAARDAGRISGDPDEIALMWWSSLHGAVNLAIAGLLDPAQARTTAIGSGRAILNGLGSPDGPRGPDGPGSPDGPRGPDGLGGPAQPSGRSAHASP